MITRFKNWLRERREKALELRLEQLAKLIHNTQECGVVIQFELVTDFIREHDGCHPEFTDLASMLLGILMAGERTIDPKPDTLRNYRDENNLP